MDRKLNGNSYFMQSFSCYTKRLFLLTLLFSSIQFLHCQTEFPQPLILYQQSYNEDLILSGNQVMDLQNTHLNVYGNVILRDSARMVLHHCVLELNGLNSFIHLRDSSTLKADTSIFGGINAGEVIDAAKAEMLKGSNLIADFNSHLILNNCFSQTQSFMGNCKVEIMNSFLVQEPLGVINIEGKADVKIQDSFIGAFYLYLPPLESITIDSLVPGYHEYWSVREDINENIPYKLVLERCELSDNNKGYKGGMELGWNLAVEAIASNVTVSNSVLNKMVFSFPQDEPAFISGLRLREPVDYGLNQINLHNTVVQTQWGIFMKGGAAELVNSEGLFILMEGGSGDIIVNNSDVGEIDPRNYNGTLIYENSQWHSGYEIFENSKINVKGTVRMLPTVPIFDSTSSMTRSYDLFLLDDEDGSPISGVDLELKKDGSTVWTGTTNEEGKVEFDIEFDINNASGKWILQTSSNNLHLNKYIGIQNSNPVYISMQPEVNKDQFRNVIHVSGGNSDFPHGTKENPYNNIQEAIDNSGGDIIYVHGGNYYGRKEPGMNIGNLHLKDSVILLGDGPDTTLIHASLDLENAKGVQISGFTFTESVNVTSSSVLLTNNVIRSSAPTAVWGYKSELKLINNTIVNHSEDAVFLHDSCTAVIKNNIIASNAGFGIRGFENAEAIIDYNDFWGNGTNYFEFFPPGENDISNDPFFYDSSNYIYSLREGSPCIDAGDPDPSMNDPDGSRNDMGAFGGPLATKSNKVVNLPDREPEDIHLFPNPVSEVLWVELKPENLPANLILCTSNGQIIKTLQTNSRFTELDMKHCKTGVYILEIRSDNRILTENVIKH